MGISRLKRQRLSFGSKSRKDRRSNEKFHSLKKSLRIACDSPSNAYRNPVEKTIRLIVHVLAVLGMLVMIIDATMEFMKSPTETTVETYKYPVQNIDYPAIAICSLNRISLAAATSLAEELLEFETTTYNVNLTVGELVDIIKILGHLYDFDLPVKDVENVNFLHTILERGYNGYSVDRIMKRLTPKCRHIIRKCSWAGNDQSCNDIFFLRITDTGYCCVFNYVRTNDKFGSSKDDEFVLLQTERAMSIGSEYGLSVLLNPQLDDKLYQILPSQGFKILVYLPLDYPDASSGGSREILIPPRTENFLNMDAVTFYSVPDIIHYDIHKRDCLFNTEQSKVFHGHYSFSDCIVHCRTRDIMELCKCIPFFLPVAEDIASARICNLKDLACLQSHRDRWLKFRPRYEFGVHSFDEANFDAKFSFLNCNCLPSCEDVSYKVSANSAPITISKVVWGRTKYSVTNHSIVHIFFGKPGTIRLRQDVLFYWYELMSNYGGICSLFLGLSIMNVIEILYAAAVAFCKSDDSDQSIPDDQKKEQGILNNESVNSAASKTSHEFFLYWNEIARPVPNTDISLLDRNFAKEQS